MPPGALRARKRPSSVASLKTSPARAGERRRRFSPCCPRERTVKRGDVLATLDGSTYEEMLRQQAITVEQAKASHLQAQLNHEIALLAVREYRDGTVQETLKGMEGTIALARSDLSRAQDHLTWTKRMSEKGYASPAQIVSEKHTVAQLELALQRQLTAMELFQRFTLSQDREKPSGTGQVRGNQPRERRPPPATPA